MPFAFRSPPILIASVCLLAGPGALVAHEKPGPGRDGGPAATVDAFHGALAAGEREAALALLTDDAVVFESGGAEMSAEEYADHHVDSDMEFSAATEREIMDRRVRRHDGRATVLTRSEIDGTFRNREIAVLSAETMILVRGEEGWRIAHIHWSSRPRQEE